MKKISLSILCLFIMQFNISCTSVFLKNEKNITVDECQDLNCVRTNIDEINKKIVILLSERMQYVIQAGKIKLKNNITNAEDKTRASQVIEQSEKFGVENNLPPGFTRKVFEEIVNGSMLHEQKDMDKSKNKD
ncbi:chorismate mutase [Fluviispira vulneris]|uniref:chorismate mutase n=1 Tax=Fluviispira vulneris TaxID=2763012 RepID=UPI0016454555|nr:chorismate mutase [Fluviispira vulneris]